jgi:RNA recognition motif-containing protein
MAVVSVKNGFLTMENEAEIAFVRAIARGRAKTIHCCFHETAVLLDDEDEEAADKSLEVVTVDRLCKVLASGALLLDSESMPESSKQWKNSDSHSLASRDTSFADISYLTDDDDDYESLNSFSTTDGDSTKRQPNSKDFANSSFANNDDAPTTMMIRNIPNQYAQKDFIQELDSLGFEGTYNFLYIPVDKKTAASCGYGFINFIDHHWAAKCASVFQDYLLTPKKGKGKYAEVSAAHLQGLEANIAHYRNTKILGGCGRKSGRVCAPLIIESLA